MKRPVICIPTSLIIKDNPWLSNSNSFHTILQLIMRFLACIVLLCTVLADFCAPTFGNTPYDLSSLTLSSGDYHVRLLSPDDSWNRTYGQMAGKSQLGLFLIFAVIPSKFLVISMGEMAVLRLLTVLWVKKPKPPEILLLPI